MEMTEELDPSGNHIPRASSFKCKKMPPSRLPDIFSPISQPLWRRIRRKLRPGSSIYKLSPLSFSSPPPLFLSLALRCLREIIRHKGASATSEFSKPSWNLLSFSVMEGCTGYRNLFCSPAQLFPSYMSSHFVLSLRPGPARRNLPPTNTDVFQKKRSNGQFCSFSFQISVLICWFS